MAASLDAVRDGASARRALFALRSRHVWPSIARPYGNEWSDRDREWLRIWFVKHQDEASARFVGSVLRLRNEGLLPAYDRFLPPLVRPIVEAHGQENERKALTIIHAIENAGRRGWLCETGMDTGLLDMLVASDGGRPFLAGGVGAITNSHGRRFELTGIETSHGTIARVISRYPCGGRELVTEFGLVADHFW